MDTHLAAAITACLPPRGRTAASGRYRLGSVSPRFSAALGGQPGREAHKMRYIAVQVGVIALGCGLRLDMALVARARKGECVGWSGEER